MSLLRVGAIPLSGYDINNSLRFRRSASAFLSRTPASAGNRTTWTWSAWVKRGSLGTEQFLFTGGDTNFNDNNIRFNADNTLTFNNYNGVNADAGVLTTSRVFRDTSAWYHIVAVWNTTTAIAADRMQLWINGVRETAFSASANPVQNQQSFNINNNVIHNIGRKANGATSYFDGYMAEVNFIAAQALTPSSFGETDTTTGVWKPKQYTGTRGANGFYLKFSDIALTSGSNTGLGRDFAGNGNFWNTNNISVTAGVTYDAMLDSPTLTSNTVCNYCTLNSNASFANSTNLRNGVPTPAATISNGNLTYSRVGAASPNGAQYIAGSVAVSSGKWYWEWVASALYTEVTAGIIDDNLNLYGFDNGRTITQTYNTAIVTGATVFTGAVGRIYGMAFDADAGTLAIYENNVLRITTTGLPAGRIWRPILGDTNSAATTTTVDINFGQRPFTYTPPTGFIRLNTFNLPEATIKKGDVHMDVTVYAGNSTSARAITNAAGFEPDLVWIKNRSSATFWNVLADNVRGATRLLFSNTQNIESVNDANGFISAFNSNGFSVTGGGSGFGNVNVTGNNYVAWQWQAGASTVTNTAGTISSQVRANTAAGFSIVTYTGTGVAATVGHGLGVTPKVIIMKNRTTASDWPYFTSAIDGSFDFLFLNTTAVKADAANTPPTSTVFTQSGNNNQGALNNNYVAYCFAEISGFSKFGSFVGNGNAFGPFINLGFRPKFVMLKNTAAATQNWVVLDSARNTFNLTSQILRPNTLDSEVTGVPGTNEPIDILSNGFMLRGIGTNGNGNGNLIMYAAFAENPFKNALAR